MKKLSKHILTLIAFFNAVFLTIPVLFFIYTSIFPLIYFFFIFITNDDTAMFFWAYWIIVGIVIFFTTIFLVEKLNRLSIKSSLAFSCFSLSIFTIFGVTHFPYHHKFPSRTVNDIVRENEAEVSKAIKMTTNSHAIPRFYNSDKEKIEHGLVKGAGSLSIVVDTIIYDETYLKYFVGIIFKTKTNQYFGQGYIGFRESANSTLKLYPFQHTTTTYKSNSFSEIQTSLRKMFFVDIKVISQYLSYDDIVYYKYSPLDKEFWNGVFFTKGPDIDSLYYFQTERNINEKRRTKLISEININ